MSETLTLAISGSFKFKPEIDALHEQFADYGATVVEPTKGWLWTPSRAPIGITVNCLSLHVGLIRSNTFLRTLYDLVSKLKDLAMLNA